MFPEGSYEIGSAVPSFFLKLFWAHNVCGRAGIFGKNPQQAKMTKNGTKNRVFELLLMAFLGKFCNNFCKIVRHEKDQEVDDNNINNFFRKILVWSKSTILGLKMVHPHKCGSSLRIF